MAELLEEGGGEEELQEGREEREKVLEQAFKLRQDRVSLSTRRTDWTNLLTSTSTTTPLTTTQPT